MAAPRSSSPPNRRDFLQRSGSIFGGAWLARFAPTLGALQACAAEARQAGLPFVTFTQEEGADFDAFAARIVPTGDTPGAREAGSVYFADRALSGELSDLLPIVREGFAMIQAWSAEISPRGRRFAQLPEEGQDRLIARVEEAEPDFFFFARALVTLGLVTDPSYGGNRDRIGWRLIGFEDAYRFEPPFGFYDRGEHGASPADGGERDAVPTDRDAHDGVPADRDAHGAVPTHRDAHGAVAERGDA